MTQDNNPLQALPIDIHFNKLLDWLLNRRHCTQQCQAYLTLIRDKLGKAVEASRAENHSDARIQNLLASEVEDLNYFRVKQLFELLKGTDAGKTNLIGQYSVKSMKNWAEIIKLYEKDGTYFVEASQMISRNVNFEVPAIKKQINKCQQTQKDCLRKENESASTSADMRRQYTAACKRMGIEGTKIKTEFASLVKELPAELEKISEEAGSLSSALEYYDAFSSFVLGDSDKSAGGVTMLRHIIAKGNTTTYEWRKGKAPSTVEEVEISIDTSDEQDAPVETDDGNGGIDWGAMDDAGIDFGDEIDFDIADITIEGGGITSASEEAARDSPDSDENGWCIVDQTTLEEKDQSVAKGKDSLRVLDNPETRNLFVDDLHELKAFLTQRITELSKLKGTENHLASAPSQIHLDSPSIVMMLDKVMSILNSLTAEKIQHLLFIRDSPRYVDRLRDSLRQKLILADKLAFKGKQMSEMRQEAAREEVELLPQIDDFRKKTKFLQTQLQGEISKKYDNRIVHIVGEINII